MSLEVKVIGEATAAIAQIAARLTPIEQSIVTLHESLSLLQQTLQVLIDRQKATTQGPPVVTPVTTTSVVIAAANPNRKGFIIFNNSGNSAYLTFGPTSVAAQCTRLLSTYSSWEIVSGSIYLGPISAIRNSGSGNISVYELT